MGQPAKRNFPSMKKLYNSNQWTASSGAASSGTTSGEQQQVQQHYLQAPSASSSSSPPSPHLKEKKGGSSKNITGWLDALFFCIYFFNHPILLASLGGQLLLMGDGDNNNNNNNNNDDDGGRGAFDEKEMMSKPLLTILCAILLVMGFVCRKRITIQSFSTKTGGVFHGVLCLALSTHAVTSKADTVLSSRRGTFFLTALILFYSLIWRPHEDEEGGQPQRKKSSSSRSDTTERSNLLFYVGMQAIATLCFIAYAVSFTVERLTTTASASMSVDFDVVRSGGVVTSSVQRFMSFFAGMVIVLRLSGIGEKIQDKEESLWITGKVIGFLMLFMCIWERNDTTTTTSSSSSSSDGFLLPSSTNARRQAHFILLCLSLCNEAFRIYELRIPLLLGTATTHATENNNEAEEEEKGWPPPGFMHIYFVLCIGGVSFAIFHNIYVLTAVIAMEFGMACLVSRKASFLSSVASQTSPSPSAAAAASSASVLSSSSTSAFAVLPQQMQQAQARRSFVPM